MKERSMLTARETDQLVHDIQREYPMFTVGERRDEGSDAFIITVRDPTNENEVAITNFEGDWRGKVAEMRSSHEAAGSEHGSI